MCPITKSAKKALRQSKKRQARNIRRKKAFKDIIKDIRKLALENKKKEAEALLPKVYKALDKAVKTGVIKKNTAARKKSRLTKLVNKIGKGETKEIKSAKPEKKVEQSKDLPQTSPEQS